VIARGARKVQWASDAAVQAVQMEQARRAWTDAQMANALGIARPHYTAARAGKRNLPFIAICRAYALGVNADALLAIRET